LREGVNVALRSFNRAANPAWYAARERAENEPAPLNLFVFGAEGNVCGGLFAETQFLWLKISILVVHAAWRGHGLGTRLLSAAEQTAQARGCQFAFLDTMEYQAPTFYAQRGYEQVCALPNWDSHGHAKLFFTKRLTS
jgi:GNAT superfamily N-acetyltransferase